MRIVKSYFGRRRRYLGLIVIFAVSIVFVNWGFKMATVHDTDDAIFDRCLRGTLATENVNYGLERDSTRSQFKSIHPTKKGDLTDVLNSTYKYISNKTSIGKAFPSKAKRASTLDAEYNRRRRAFKKKSRFKSILPTKKRDPTDVLHSTIYISNKTSFEDAFPPNAKKASTLDTEFIIGNFEICKNTDLLAYIVVVHSAVNNTERRESIRTTWGKRNLIQGLQSRTIFLLGQTEDKMAQYQLCKENALYGDLIQGQFRDTHDNLTLKNVMGLKWLSNYCSNVKVVVKVDDDVFVNIFRARELYFNNLERSPKQIICDVGTKNYILRYADFPRLVFDKSACVSDGYFKGLRWYPMPWCFGYAVFMSMGFVRELYQAALITPTYPLDDVYVYGILASTIKDASWRNEDDRFSPGEDETKSNWEYSGKKQPFIVGTFRSAATAQKLWFSMMDSWSK